MDPTDFPWIAALLPRAEDLALGVAVALARAGGLLLALPSLSAQVVPRSVKAIVAVALSLSLVWSGLGPGFASLGPAPEWGFVVVVFRELIFGLAMGFIVHVTLAAARIAGELVGMEMGLSFAAVADPLSPAPATAPSALFAQVAVQLFLALGLDHACVRVLATSTKAHPLGTAEVSSDAIASMVALGSSMLVNALSLAVPVMAAIFALKVALAFLARAAPKLQIFSLAFGISILVGLAVLEAATPGIVASLGRQLREGVETLSRFALVA